MSDPQKAEKALAAIYPVGRRRLSFNEVVETGRPALYSQFGDALLFMDGVVFAHRPLAQDASW